MGTGDDKRLCRELKRTIKKAGTRRRRQAEKRALEDQPDDAHGTEFDFGRCSSASLNGLDNDRTRQRHAKRHERSEE